MLFMIIWYLVQLVTVTRYYLSKPLNCHFLFYNGT